MGLLNRFFRKDPRPESPSTSLLDDDDSQTTDQPLARNARQRELVQMVLREVMRKHGIPSDWMQARILSVVGEREVPGMHVLLVVHEGDERLAAYVHAFQQSFLQEVMRVEPRALEWIYSISWQFEGAPAPACSAMPDPSAWAGARAAAPAPPAPAADAELQEDLRALFAIRDAALRDDGPPRDFEPTQPGFAADDEAAERARRR